MEIIFSRKFKKQAKKIVENKKNLQEKINNCIIDFSEQVRASKYWRKKLTGSMFGYEELQIGGDIRIIIRVRISHNMTVFEQIGTHAELFG